jgi:hypothetical protein
MTKEALKYEMRTKIQNEDVLLQRVIKPIREKITLVDLIREQNYKGFDRLAFDKLVKELDIQDPIEELLALSTS